MVLLCTLQIEGRHQERERGVGSVPWEWRGGAVPPESKRKGAACSGI
jgi:hypothetical protein